VAADALKIEGGSAEQLRDSINAAGWASDRVLCACIARQGHSPSIAGAILLYGLAGLLLPGSRLLPRTFVMAASAERVFAFKARGLAVGERDYRVTVYPGEEASWPRGEASMSPAKAGMTANGWLQVPGDKGPTRIRCAAPNSQVNPALEQMIALLGANGDATP